MKESATDNQQSEGNIRPKEFRRREWLMTIGLIVLLILLIGSWTIEAVPDSSVINYVSFAGTITSIILALLAIVYSYYRSISQRQNSEKIASQIGRLDKTVGNLEFSEGQFSRELNRIDKIGNQLEDNLSTSRRTRAIAEEMSEQVASLASSLSEDPSTESTEGLFTGKSMHDFVVGSGSKPERLALVNRLRIDEDGEGSALSEKRVSDVYFAHKERRFMNEDENITGMIVMVNYFYTRLALLEGLHKSQPLRDDVRPVVVKEILEKPADDAERTVFEAILNAKHVAN